MADTYSGFNPGLNAPAYNAVAVTPSNSADLAVTSRALYVGASGDITMTLENDSASVLFKNVPVGILSVRAKRVHATGTSATNIVALN